MSGSDLILGWDVGGTKSAAVVASRGGRVVARQQWPSQADRGPDAMIAEFLNHAADLRRAHRGVSAVGVSIGGPMDAVRGVILSPPHLPGWDRVPLADRLADELGLPVVVEHDAAACLLAEWLWGAAAGCTHAAYFTCGTGFGAGLLIDGRVLRGPGGASPELGHVRIADDGPVVFDKAGCIESFAGGQGISLLAPFLFPARFDGPVEPRRLIELRDAGDAEATAVLAEAARRTGQAAAMLADIFAPQVIVLGSLAARFGPQWVQQVREAMEREALPARAATTRIATAGLGDRLQDLSPIAACLYRQGALLKPAREVFTNHRGTEAQRDRERKG
ncbi:MAG: Glucokinase [Phycisphaerae bacterium]|nr:Glucokinase [Phycisphaerae bacterium]